MIERGDEPIRRGASRFWGWARADRWGRGRPPAARAVILAVWLAFIVFPIYNAFSDGVSEPGHALEIAGAFVFTAAYVWLVLIWIDLPESPLAYALAGAEVVIAVALTVGVGWEWGFLFSYCAACAALVAPSGYGVHIVLGIAVLALAIGLAAGAGVGNAIGSGASAAGVGLLLALLRDLRMRNAELDTARAELARTAVAAERERFARDLHDLLGHSLSVIAIKAELAGRLLSRDPDRAGGEIAELEGVARAALGEVRDAVSGYRRPTLEGELEGARVALAAAGIIADFERSPVSLPPDVEAVLAWAVREGATNVIRHSGARRCEVRVRAADANAAVEVLDDGSGCRRGDGRDGDEPRPTPVGNGLAGLRERAATVRGRLDAGTISGGGGFRLAVSVPVSVRDPVAAPTPASASASAPASVPAETAT